jgi:hypothetical protein
MRPSVHVTLEVPNPAGSLDFGARPERWNPGFDSSALMLDDSILLKLNPISLLSVTLFFKP